jgi:hypothetical protein
MFENRGVGDTVAAELFGTVNDTNSVELKGSLFDVRVVGGNTNVGNF